VLNLAYPFISGIIHLAGIALDGERKESPRDGAATRLPTVIPWAWLAARPSSKVFALVVRSSAVGEGRPEARRLLHLPAALSGRAWSRSSFDMRHHVPRQDRGQERAERVACEAGRRSERLTAILPRPKTDAPGGWPYLSVGAVGGPTAKRGTGCLEDMIRLGKGVSRLVFAVPCVHRSASAVGVVGVGHGFQQAGTGASGVGSVLGGSRVALLRRCRALSCIVGPVGRRTHAPPIIWT
jgi:hypothetical protein